MIVCICHGISDGDLREAVRSGKIQEFLSIKMLNMSCGTCTFDIEKTLDQFVVEQNVDSD